MMTFTEWQLSYKLHQPIHVSGIFCSDIISVEYSNTQLQVMNWSVNCCIIQLHCRLAHENQPVAKLIFWLFELRILNQKHLVYAGVMSTCRLIQSNMNHNLFFLRARVCRSFLKEWCLQEPENDTYKLLKHWAWRALSGWPSLSQERLFGVTTNPCLHLSWLWKPSKKRTL